MSLVTIFTTLNQYMLDNYSEPLKINLPDVTFDDTGIDKWISVDFQPTSADSVAFNGTIEGRELIAGVYTVRAYAEYKVVSLVVADEVKGLLRGKQLSNGVHLGNATITPPIDLENNLWETSLTFDVTQF